MWVELRGGPMDGRQLRVPNDAREVTLPLPNDPLTPMLVGGAEPRLNLRYVTYAPVEADNPFWRVSYMSLP